MKKIAITGGVLTPALALIDELKKRGGWEIYYFGRKHATEGEKTPSIESRVIPALGIKFVTIHPGRLQRCFTRYTIPALLKVPIGFVQSLWSLTKIRPDVVCSFGGYVSVPVVFAGWLLGIPVFTHEQTVVFGLASKINAFFAKKIAVSFEQSLTYFPKDKVILTGNPLRGEIFQSKKSLRFLSMSSDFLIIYVTGGNQGSHLINKLLIEILPQILDKYVIVHQTGERDFEEMLNAKNKLSEKLQSHYYPVAYINANDIGWVLNKASLIISRAGANTVCEVAALGKPAIFIPIPWSYQDEQTKSAKLLQEIGLAEIITQNDLTGESLLTKVTHMFNNLEDYKKNSDKAKKIVRLDAVKKIADEITTIAKKI